MAMQQAEKVKKNDENNDSLLTLVQPHLPVLSELWIHALRDVALLRLPREFQNHIPKEGFQNSQNVN